jgi:uncharacterized protein YecE (DUF72 family)
MAESTAVRVGTSGWIYKHWRGVFYPPKLPVSRWFAFYAGHFDTVEINNSFYRLPSPAAFDAWRTQAPRGFVYAVKASRYLTHLKKLKDPAKPLHNILSRARRLKSRIGPVLYQLPPYWGCNVERLRAFVERLPLDLTHVLEFRDPSWYVDAVRDVLSEAGVGFCIHDMRGSASPRWVTGPAVYLRFHGPTERKYAGRYGPELLRPWAERIGEWQQDGRAVYVYFNNDDRGFALADANEMRELLGQETAELPVPDGVR